MSPDIHDITTYTNEDKRIRTTTRTTRTTRRKRFVLGARRARRTRQADDGFFRRPTARFTRRCAGRVRASARFLDARDVEREAVALEALAAPPDVFRKEKACCPDARAGPAVADRRRARGDSKSHRGDAVWAAARVLFSDDDGYMMKDSMEIDSQWNVPLTHPRLAMTTAYKWLLRWRGEFTVRTRPRVPGARPLVTAWIPLGDVRVADGALMVAAGSHAMPRSRACAGRTARPPRRGRRVRAGSPTTRRGAHVARGDRERRAAPRRAPSVKAKLVTWGTEEFIWKKTFRKKRFETIDWRTCDFRSGTPCCSRRTRACRRRTSRPGGEERARCLVDTRWQPEGDEPDPRVRVWRRRREGVWRR